MPKRCLRAFFDWKVDYLLLLEYLMGSWVRDAAGAGKRRYDASGSASASDYL